MQKFTWMISDARSDSIIISIDLAYPELFGKDSSDPEYITVKASFSDFEPGW